MDQFESLLEAHLEGLYTVALRYTRDPVHAQDIVHDTAVRALRFRNRFEQGSNFKAWIYTILTNTFIHRYRRQKREREILEGSSQQDVACQLRSESTQQWARQPEHAYLDRLLSDDVMRALEELPEDFRSVVVLCDIEGFKYKDIAKVVKRPVGTVMSRLYRARRMLESKLARLAVEQGILKKMQPQIHSPQICPNPLCPIDDEATDAADMTVFRRRKHG